MLFLSTDMSESSLSKQSIVEKKLDVISQNVKELCRLNTAAGITTLFRILIISRDALEKAKSVQAKKAANTVVKMENIKIEDDSAE